MAKKPTLCVSSFALIHFGTCKSPNFQIERIMLKTLFPIYSISIGYSLMFHKQSLFYDMQIYEEAESRANVFAMPRRYSINDEVKYTKKPRAEQMYLLCRGTTV